MLWAPTACYSPRPSVACLPFTRLLWHSSIAYKVNGSLVAGGRWLELDGWRQVAGGRWLEAGGCRQVAGGRWLVVGGWWLEGCGRRMVVWLVGWYGRSIQGMAYRYRTEPKLRNTGNRYT